MKIICTSSFSLIFQFSPLYQMYEIVKLFSDRNYQSCPPDASALAIQFHPSFLPALVFLWSDSELVHGTDPAENNFLFKGCETGRPMALACCILLWSNTLSVGVKHMLAPKLLSLIVSRNDSLCMILQPAASITDIKGNESFRNSKVRFKIFIFVLRDIQKLSGHSSGQLVLGGPT